MRPESWSHLVFVTGRQMQYQMAVLGNDTVTVTHNLAYLSKLKPLRVSAVFVSPFDMVDFS